jgi:hypothetical protein
MSFHYQFSDRESGIVVPLDSIDREICDITGYPYSPTKYCPAYQIATFFLLGVAVKGDVTLDTVDSALDAYSAGTELATVARHLITRYNFMAWRG